MFLYIISFWTTMMFGFIDSASEHAVALLHFHHYACFFLLVVIFFVVWLLKMILKFSILEKNLLGNSNTNFNLLGSNSFFLNFKLVLFSFVFFFLFFFKNFSSVIFNFFLDIYRVILITFRVRKLRASYGIHKSLYPDLGIYIDSFSTLPALTTSKYEFKRPVRSNFFSLFLNKRSKIASFGLKTLRNSLYEVPALFPYERIRIPSYGPWKDVETMVTHTTFFISYFYGLKLAFWGDLFGGRLSTKNDSLLGYSNKFSLSLFLQRKNFSILNMSPSVLVGSQAFKNDNTSKRIFKGYSNYLSHFYYFSKFCSSESRMFFYLFFQNVRHRKVLEWVWTCVPAAILIMLLYPSLSLLYCYDRPYITKPYLTFKAIGHQWYWSYEYSDYVFGGSPVEHLKFDSYMIHEDDLSFGHFRLLEVDRRIVLPVGVCIRLVATSADVLHSWAVPALGVKIDAVPGRLNQFWIIVDRPGTFYGQCSELCGVNHGFMPIVAEGVDLNSFFNYLDTVYSN